MTSDEENNFVRSAKDLLEACEIAEQLATIAIDWNLDSVEINGEMLSTYDVRNILRKAINQAKGVS